MFHNCDALDFDLSAWKTSRVTTLAHFLDGAEAFTGAGYQPLLPWDVSSVTDLSYAFHNTGRVDFDLSLWNIRNVQTMQGMFHTAVAFTGRGLEQWQTSATALVDLSHAFQDTWNFNADLSAWNTDSVKDLTATFASASAFDQDLSRWNVASVERFVETFHGAHAFNQDLCAWRTQAKGTSVWDKTFIETACPDSNTPYFQDGTWTGSFCHVCETKDDQNNHAAPSNNSGHPPYFPTAGEDTQRPKFSSDDDVDGKDVNDDDDDSIITPKRKKSTTLQVFEHDIDLLAMAIAFCSGGALVGWLVRRHMLRQRILRRHMEVYAQVQPYDLDDSVELTSSAAMAMNGSASSSTNGGGVGMGDDPWDPHREDGKRPFFT